MRGMWNVPRRNPLFVGREAQLTAIWAKLQPSTTACSSTEDADSNQVMRASKLYVNISHAWIVRSMVDDM